MSLQSFYGANIEIPPLIQNGSTLGSAALTMDLAGEQVHCIGSIYLEGGTAGGTKTISSAGGKIHWRSGTTTWATALSAIRLGIQELSTVTAPAQGNGTFDVYKELVQGTDLIPTVAAQATSMAVGTKTITHGQKLAVAFHMTVRNGADSVITTQYAPAFAASAFHFPAVMLGTPTFSRQAVSPTVLIEFDDGTLGWFAPSCPLFGASSTAVFASNTGTADEYGNVYTPNVTMRTVGITANVQAASTADFEICLYSDPLGTPTLIEAVTVDATQLGNPGFTGAVSFMFTTERTLTAGTSYGLTFRPTTVNQIIGYFQDVVAATHWKAFSLGDTCYSIRRLDNAGAFTDYNGGTAKTRRMNISLLVDQFDDGAGGGAAGMKQSHMNGNFSG